jgi:hypothetical protein
MAIFFALFLLCGFSYEGNFIQREITPTAKVPLWINTIYTVGGLWFLFWTEPYILHGFMVALMILSAIRSMIPEETTWKHKYEMLDCILSLILICLMGFHFIVYNLRQL